MNEKQQNKLIPRLRFPESKDSGEWEIKPLSKVLIKNSTKNKLLKYKLVQSVSNKYGFINQEEYFDNRKIASKNTSNYYVIKKGYFAYNPSRIDVGSLAYKSDDKVSIISPLYVSFRADNKEINDLFLLSWFSSFGFKKQMIFEGGVRNTLSFDNLIKIKIPVPQPAEQQKIASCLSSLDELLEARKQKLELLKTHKKGLMQNLFPKESEKVPKLRFQEFKDSGEWEVEPLGNISKKINEKTKGRKFKLMSITAGEGLVSQIEKFGREIAGNSYKNYYVIHKNDFAYNKSSTKYYPQGEIAMYEDKEVGAVPNSIFTCFRFDEEIIHPTFAKYHFTNNLHGKWLLNFITIGARAHGALQVNEKDLFSVPFPFPSLAEQQKIASCLSSLDELITAEAEKIEQLEKQKKGLMQGLFPELN